LITSGVVTRVGFIGLGIMGRPMAENLLKKGFDVMVHSRSPTKVDAVVGAGARRGESPAAVAAESEIVITMVPDSPDVVAVARGERGIFAGAKPGLIVADMSTISPAVTRELAAEAADRQVQWLDAPVSGGEGGAIAGTLSIMIGGDTAAVERARPVLLAMGKVVTHIGPSGHGQTAKLCNQILVAVNLLAVSEALVFGAKAGLNLERIHEALAGGAAGSWAFQNLGRKMIDRDFAPAFKVSLLQKDLRLVGEAARDLGTPVIGTELVRQLARSLEAHGHGEDGTQALVTVLEGLADTLVEKTRTT
jgi:3-hydroxyisobutyrate dehydrogenase